MKRSGSLLNGIDLLTLRLLVAAAEEGNLARVASRESLAISAVSRRISEFERRFGFAMFDRHDRGVIPTPDGQSLLAKIRLMLGETEHIARLLLDRRDGRAGIIRVQSHTSSIASGLPQRIAQFLKLHPDIDVLLCERTSQEIVHAIQSAQCDVGLISGTVQAQGLQVTELDGDELVVILPADSWLARRDTLCLTELVTERFVCMQRESALLSLFRTHAAAHDLMLDERIYCSSFENVRAFVAAGLGIAVVPSTTVPTDLVERQLVSRPLNEPWAKRPLQLCHREIEHVSAATRLFVEHLKSQ